MQTVTIKESWTDLAAGWVSWCPCPQYHIWRLCKGCPQCLLGFVWLLLGFLSSLHQVQGCAVGSDFDFLNLFVTLYKGMVLREYKLKSKWLAVEFLRIFPELSLRLCFVVQLPMRSTDRETVISYMLLHWMCQISVPPSKEKYFCLYEVQGNSSGGGESLWLRETSFINRQIQITPQGLPHSLPEESHKKHRQENKRWLKTCHSEEEAWNLYPCVYLIVPDIVDIWRDCLARISWRNRLRIATGSNQTDFRGQRRNPQLAKVDR